MQMKALIFVAALTNSSHTFYLVSFNPCHLGCVFGQEVDSRIRDFFFGYLSMTCLHIIRSHFLVTKKRICCLYVIGMSKEFGNALAWVRCHCLSYFYQSFDSS